MATYRITDEQNVLLVKGKGQSIQNGTGVATSFTITHGVTGIVDTNQVFVTPRRANGKSDAGNYSSVELSSTQITIYYSVAPQTDTANLKWDWVII